MSRMIALRLGIVFLCLACLIGLAMAQMTTLSNRPMVPTANPVGPMVNDGLAGPMIPGTAGTPTPPPVTCGTGVIDLSTGCTMPMLGGL